MSLGRFTHLGKHPAPCTLIHTLPFPLFASQSQKPHPHDASYVVNCAARTSIHVQCPWLLCTSSFHAHPWLWPAYLPCPSVWTAVCLLVGGKILGTRQNFQTMQEVYVGKLHSLVKDICLMRRAFSLEASVTLHSIIPVEIRYPNQKIQISKPKWEIVTEHAFEKWNW